MKNLIYTLIIFSLISIYGNAQNVVNPDGSIKFRGNVAVLSKANFFSFDANGNSIQNDIKEANEITNMLETALRIMAQEKFGNMAFGIVNRDDQAYENVKRTLEENKLEDYLNGYSIQAKNQGADWIYIIDCNIITQGDAAQLFLDSRLVNVENNLGFHDHYVSTPISLNKMQNEISGIVKEFMKDTETFLYGQFPEQYFINNVDGKTLELGAYQTNGRILNDDKFYVYEISRSSLAIPEGTINFQVFQPIGEASSPEIKDGKLYVKANKKISSNSNIVLVRNAPELLIKDGTMTATYFSIPVKGNDMDDFIKTRINNSVLTTMTNNPFVTLIEQDHLSDLHKERELQKSEDFLNGHTIDQMKAIGAQYILQIENYNNNNGEITFKLSVIDVAQNMIMRQVDIVSNIDDLEKNLYKALSERFATVPLNLEIGKNQLSFFTIPSLPEGTNIVLEGINVVENPLTGEQVFNIIPLCYLTVTESLGNKSILKIDSKTDALPDINSLDSYYRNGLLSMKVDGSKIKLRNSSSSALEKATIKEEKKKKGGFLNKMKDVMNNVKSSIELKHN